MTEPVATSLQLPSVAEVMAELVTIRRTHGLTRNCVEDHGHKIQWLPAVTDHLRREQMQPQDRPLAAFSVVNCAVEGLVPDYRHRVVLQHTLNIVHGRGRSDSLPTMARRRANAAADLVISDPTSAHMDELVKGAYRELAGALVGARWSPCDDEAAMRESLARVRRAQEILAAAENEILMALGGLSHEKDPAVRNAYTEALLASLPIGAELSGLSQDAQAVARELIELAVRYAYPDQDDPSYLNFLELYKMLVSDHAGWWWAWNHTARKYQKRIGIAPEVHYIATDEFYEAKRRSLIRLAEALIEMERRGWAVTPEGDREPDGESRRAAEAEGEGEDD